MSGVFQRLIYYKRTLAQVQDFLQNVKKKFSSRISEITILMNI